MFLYVCVINFLVQMYVIYASGIFLSSVYRSLDPEKDRHLNASQALFLPERTILRPSENVISLYAQNSYQRS